MRRTGLLRRRCEHGRWRLEPAAGIGFEEAVEDMRSRRKSRTTGSAGRVRPNGVVVLYVPSRYQSSTFHGRLQQRADGGLEFTGVMKETLSAALMPLIYGFVTLLMLALIALGALTDVWPPLVIGVVAAPIMGTLTVSFHRNRGRDYAMYSRRLYGNLAGLLAPLNPQPLGSDSPELDG